MTRTEIETACRLAADLVPGASISPRKGGKDRQSMLIVLPVRGLHVRVSIKDDSAGAVGTLELVMPAHHTAVAWTNVPAFTKTDRGAKRIAECITHLVNDAVDGAPRRHARMGTPARHRKLDTWVPPDERGAALVVCQATGMTMSELLRRGLRLATEEALKFDPDLHHSGRTRHARQTLRLLAACDPDACTDEMVQVAHVGSPFDVVRDLRRALSHLSETNVLAAELLGVGWLYDEGKPASAQGTK